ncbi:MAG: hypothetical protein ACYTEQ_26380 [Planctomycetota bacterium]
MRITTQDAAIDVVRNGTDVVVTISKADDAGKDLRRIYLSPTHALILVAALKEHGNDARKMKYGK